MLSTTEMVIVILAILILGAISGIIMYKIRSRNNIYINDFANNIIPRRMKNSDISIDEVIEIFKTLK